MPIAAIAAACTIAAGTIATDTETSFYAALQYTKISNQAGVALSEVPGLVAMVEEGRVWRIEEAMGVKADKEANDGFVIEVTSEDGAAFFVPSNSLTCK